MKKILQLILTLFKASDKPRKFAVRVVHFKDEYYSVEYAYYRARPTWYTISKFISHGFFSGLEGWNPCLYKVEEAEVFAQKFKCIEDVQAFEMKEKDQEYCFYKNKQIHFQRAQPYQSRQII